MIRVGTGARLMLATLVVTSLALAVLGSSMLWALASADLHQLRRQAGQQALSAALLASVPGRGSQHLSANDPGMVSGAAGTSLYLQVSSGGRVVQRSANLGGRTLPVTLPRPSPVRWGRVPLWGLSAPIGHVGGVAVLLAKAPVTLDGRPTADAVEAAVPLTGLAAAVDLVGAGLVRVGILLMLLAVLAMSALAALTFRRLGRLERRVWRIQSGSDLAQRLPVEGPEDEVRSLARAFNQMLDRLEASFVRQGTAVAHASHQLRTPLAAALGYADLLERWGMDDPNLAREGLRVIREQLTTLRDRLSAVLRLSAWNGDPNVHLETIDLARFLDEWTAAQPGPVTVAPGQGTQRLRADPDLMREALDTLRDNITRHAGPNVKAVLGWTVVDGGRTVALSLRDFGPGFAPEVLDRPFRPFAPGPASTGTGLGMSLVAAVARAHGGRVEASNAPDGGAVVRLFLPVGEL